MSNTQILCKEIKNNKYELMSEYTTKLFVSLILIENDEKALQEVKTFANNMYESSTIAAIIY